MVTGEPVTIQVAVSGSAQELDIHQQKFDLYTEEHPERDHRAGGHWHRAFPEAD